MSTANRLSRETSPYLQQHANNPVDWYPWESEALEKARQENKPILLSIGYSACHWCHVMAHESFSDPETASLMNKLFINIKVDREERPDLDKIYQTTHQLLTHNAGGWPLTVFLSPLNHTPFFTGTYFPKEAHYQLPAFKDVLKQVAEFYQTKQQHINDSAHIIVKTLQEFSTSSNFQPTTALNITPWKNAIEQLFLAFDAIHGGFGGAPKFPPHSYLRLLIYDCNSNDKDQAINNSIHKMIQLTLTVMAQGGIYDQIGGGFYRYAVDERWEIPHFEKMLYDNSQLLIFYTQADNICPNPLYKKIVYETVTWLIQEMQSPQGGYYSAIDADSEGKEGHFYVWTPEQIESLLATNEYTQISQYFNLQTTANFESSWHLHINRPLEVIAQDYKLPMDYIENTVRAARTKLYLARQQRVPPNKDDKILTAWNALTIKALLSAGMYYQQPEWINSAERALNFIRECLWQNGRLLATYKDGHAHLALAAYLDDYAFLLDATLTFLQYRWCTKILLFAQALADTLLQRFADHEHGGFFFVADDHEALLYRPKTWADEVIPSGNGIACFALQRLGYLLAEERYLSYVEKTLKSAWPAINQYSVAHSSLLITLREYLQPPEIIIIRGENNQVRQWQEKLYSQRKSNQLIFAIPNEEIALPKSIAEKKAIANPTAYKCVGFKCLPAVTDLTELT